VYGLLMGVGFGGSFSSNLFTFFFGSTFRDKGLFLISDFFTSLEDFINTAGRVDSMLLVVISTDSH